MEEEEVTALWEGASGSGPCVADAVELCIAAIVPRQAPQPRPRPGETAVHSHLSPAATLHEDASRVGKTAGSGP